MLEEILDVLFDFCLLHGKFHLLLLEQRYDLPCQPPSEHSLDSQGSLFFPQFLQSLHLLLHLNLRHRLRIILIRTRHGTSRPSPRLSPLMRRGRMLRSRVLTLLHLLLVSQVLRLSFTLFRVLHI